MAAPPLGSRPKGPRWPTTTSARGALKGPSGPPASQAYFLMEEGHSPPAPMGAAPGTPAPQRRDREEDTRNRRVQKRLAIALRRPPPAGMTFLRNVAVGESTAESYSASLTLLREWWGSAIPHRDPVLVDDGLSEFLDQLFFEGHELHVGTRLLAAVLHQWPALGRGSRQSLPQSRQALQGWAKLNPPRARLPLPWMVVSAIVDQIREVGYPKVAALTLLTFHGYLRPGVAASLVPSQLTPPVAKRRRGETAGPLHRWSLNLHLAEWERPSKTGTWDETLELCDRPEWEFLAPILEAAWGSLCRRPAPAGTAGRAPPKTVAPANTLGGVAQAQWAALVKAAGRTLGLPAAEPAHLYRLRHGGASFDVGNRIRTLDEVQKRGSWRTQASVARYAKPARINEQLARLSTTARARVERRQREMPRKLIAALSTARGSPPSRAEASRCRRGRVVCRDA